MSVKPHKHLLVAIVLIVCTALFTLVACNNNPTKDNMQDTANEMSEDMKQAGQDAANGTVPKAESLTYTVYFANSDGTKLVAEERTEKTNDVLDKKTTDAKARMVLEKLIDGPEQSGNKAVLPRTTMINAVTLNSDGVLDIDLSESVVTDFNDLGIDENLAVNAIAASMKQLPEVKKVRITVDKNALRFNDKEYTEAITVDESLIAK